MKQDLLKILSAAVLDDISQPIQVEDDLRSFLESFCNVTSVSDFEALIHDEADELDVFYERVIFPSGDVQEEMEDIIENTALTEDDLSELYDYIARDYIGTPLVFSDNSTITLHPPEGVLTKYLTRLRLTQKLPEQLTDAIRSSLYAGYQKTARVILKNSSVVFRQADIAFLCRVISWFGFDAQTIDPVFRFAVKTIEENPRNISYKELLLARKQAFSELKAQVQKLRTTLEKSTVESIMMQGITIPSQSVETMEETVRVIDLLLGCLQEQ